MNWKSFLPFILQAVALLGAGWTYAASQEHRLTVVEEALKSQSAIYLQLAHTQEIMAQQIGHIEQTQARLVALEEYVHKRD